MVVLIPMALMMGLATAIVLHEHYVSTKRTEEKE
jgi:hypothetical protein